VTDLRRLRADRRTGEVREMNDDELIEHALSWAVDMLRARDEMNAAVHCTAVRYSPVTQLVLDAHVLAVKRLS
jgi:hypothetical protein